MLKATVWENDEMMFSNGKTNHTKHFRAPGKATYLELWNIFSGSLTHCQLTNIIGKQHLRQQQQQHQQSEQNTTKIIAGVPGEKPLVTSDKLPDSPSKFPCIHLWMTRRIWHCIKSHLRPYSTHPFNGLTCFWNGI